MLTQTNIPTLMKERGVKQIDVLRKCELGNETISRISHGQLNVTLKSFVVFCDAAGFSLQDALIGTELEKGL